MKRKQQEIKYHHTYTDDFVESRHQNKQLPKHYKWIHTNPIYRITANIVYGIAFVFALLYSKLILHIKIENKQVLKKDAGSGYILYGNHTQPIGDVFAPATYLAPKRMYTVASPANLGIPFIGRLLPMLGALVVPDSLRDMPDFMEALRLHLRNKKCIVIYPEAHVWPYCNFIRPFPYTSFRFPVAFDVPCFCMTTTYQKPRRGNKPKITVYIDGPFYAGKDATPKEEQKRLHDEIYECMKKRSQLSNYAYIRYEKGSL